MTLNANLTVREIASENPAAIRVFESFGIDYCCGGRRSLEEACAAGSVALDTVLQSLTAASQTLAVEDAEKWVDADLSALPPASKAPDRSTVLPIDSVTQRIKLSTFEGIVASISATTADNLIGVRDEALHSADLARTAT